MFKDIELSRDIMTNFRLHMESRVTPTKKSTPPTTNESTEEESRDRQMDDVIEDEFVDEMQIKVGYISTSNVVML